VIVAVDVGVIVVIGPLNVEDRGFGVLGPPRPLCRAIAEALPEGGHQQLLFIVEEAVPC